jgi:hypothetical protein
MHRPTASPQMNCDFPLFFAPQTAALMPQKRVLEDEFEPRTLVENAQRLANVLE